MEVGIEDCLHIEFEYDKSRYHLKDTVVGKIYFLLVRIKLKHMEVCPQSRRLVRSRGFRVSKASGVCDPVLMVDHVAEASAGACIL